MTIILDFDDVLFDTKKLKMRLAGIFKKYNIDFYKYYNKAKESKGAYSLKKHLLLAKKENKKIDTKKIEKEISKLKFKKFLFSDVINFLKIFRNQDLILLSWGNKEFQNRKIYGLGKEFTSFFDRIIAGPVNKAKILRKILKSHKSRPVIFIDNSQKELENIKNRFKNVVLIKLKRGFGQGSSSKKYLELTNLTKAGKWLKRINQ